MNIDKIKIEKPIIYIYARRKDGVDSQLNSILNYCKLNDIVYSNIYIDTGVNNKLKEKQNLLKLINENSNKIVLIRKTDRVARELFDFIQLKNISNKNKIKFYDISIEMFSFDFLIWNPKELTKGSDENMEKNIDVLFIEPNCLPVKIRIENDLDEYQKLVEGLIEYIHIPDCDDVVIVCNEEGKIRNLPINRDIGHDIIVGNFFIVGIDPENEVEISLTEEQVEKYSKMFDKESIIKTKEKYDKINNDSLEM